MQGSFWVQLLQRIPEQHHENLVLVTTAGAEIMVQRIICHEDTYMILRGRPAGSTEVARTILLPFDQLNYLAFLKAVRERDVLAMFATESTVVLAPPTNQPGAEVENQAAAAEETPSTAGEAPVPPVPAQLPPASPAEPNAAPSGPPSKSFLLARLRARLGKG